MRANTRAILDDLGIGLDPERAVESLTVAERQLLEVVRALSYDASVLVMDEPTASLSQGERALLLDIVRRLRSQGLSIVYISHRLDEVIELADRITVLKDGVRVATLANTNVSQADLVRLMVGREVAHNLFPDRSADVGHPLLLVKDLSDEGLIDDVSFAVRAGEIVGVAGLIGAGRSSLARAIFGVSQSTRGRVEVDGVPLRRGSPVAALRAGVAYLGEDRKRDGLAMNLSATRNLNAIRQPGRLGIVDRNAERKHAMRLAGMVRLAPSGLSLTAKQLSGGNQQKVVLGKWLATNPKVLVVDEPTIGIDVGAKAEIYRVLRRLADDGTAILMMSSDLLEVLHLSDRILIMRKGRIVAEFTAAEATEERILASAMGVAA
jgi:rhamnose transport system ATP-binding protein